jgi:hypothetical protein
MARAMAGSWPYHFQTLPERRFSALNSVMPWSIPMTSVSTHSVDGLNASAKP